MAHIFDQICKVLYFAAWFWYGYDDYLAQLFDNSRFGDIPLFIWIICIVVFGIIVEDEKNQSS
jgi:hypothetical protein